MEFTEKIIVILIKKRINMGEILFDFVQRVGIIDAIFLVRQFAKEYSARSKLLYLVFVDLERPLTKSHAP